MKRLIAFIALWSTSFVCALTLEQQSLQEEFENRIRSNPNDARAYFEYGRALADWDEEQQYEKVIELMQRSVALQEDFNHLFALGTFCCRVGKFQESLTAYMHILEKRPMLLPVLYNSGYVLKLAGRFDLAIALFQKILDEQPEYEAAHVSLAFSYLQQGDFEHGFQAHVWNLKKQGKYAENLRDLIQNKTIENKRILLIPEGGMGDTIQFVRYAKRLHDEGAYVIVVVQPSLMKLLARCPYIDFLMPVHSPVPAHDASATLMSLPALFADTERTIPCPIPYIFPDHARMYHWHQQLARDHSFKIGICWQPDVHNDISRLPIARRGIPLALFERMSTLPGVTLYSLQKHDGIEQLKNIPASMSLHVFDESFDVAHGSFVDTAAVMMEMDLIISADTATAHLAGALGKPVWLLLPYVTDWRWIHNRTDSPWYPTMRIFKQPAPFDWHGAINMVYVCLLQELRK